MASEVRRRKQEPVASRPSDAASRDAEDTKKEAGPKLLVATWDQTWASSKDNSLGLVLIICILAFATRFWMLWNPPEVVFDEVHFGKFANGYLTGKFFFDIHPPLGKMLLAWAAGFNKEYHADFEFKNIGDKYEDGHHVPYLLLRGAPAFASALTCPLVFFTARQLGASLTASFLAACMIVFDTALLVQSRLILIDSFLFFFITLAMLCSFCLHSYTQDDRRLFSRGYYFWLVATGVSAGLAASVKWTALAAVGAIGLHHVIMPFAPMRLPRLAFRLVRALGGLLRQLAGRPPLEEETLYNLRAKGATGSLPRLFGDLLTRALFLAALPVVVYVFFQWLHFRMLPLSGPGDPFMTPAFRATLEGSLSAGERAAAGPISFFEKTWEMMRTMYATNAAIKEPHSWQSEWWTWPLNKRGIHYWQGRSPGNHPETGEALAVRIYLLGNPAVWWGSSVLVAISLVVGGAMLLFEIPFSAASQRYLSLTAFLFMEWLLNLLPYVPIKRCTFLYHYFPALLCAIYMSAVLLERVFGGRPRLLKAVAAALLAVIVAAYWYWSPFVYALPLTNSQFEARVWLNGWR
eukprot:tig00000478_g1261.t1